MLRFLTIMMITLAGFNVRSESSVYGPEYIDVEAYEGGFVVLDAEGGLHFYDSRSRETSSSKPEGMEKCRFICTVADAVIAADGTSMTCFLDGRWISMPVPEGIRITGITGFYGGVIATAEEGKLLFWSSPFDNARSVTSGIKGEFIDIDSFGDRCHAVSDSSETVTVDLALRTRIFDFNDCYSDYYGDIDIVSTACGSTSVCITGTRSDGSPATFISSDGNVWSERSMDYLEGGSMMYLDKKPITAAYREYDDCYVLLCEGGVIFHLPACSHCNYPIFSGSEKLNSIAFNGRSFMAAGDGIY
ncbi:MAG: hypothetical protein IJ971_03155 [Bacteroidales bacterium]|nr:hypothetical protein [Bacteroidales bacterium]